MSLANFSEKLFCRTPVNMYQSCIYNQLEGRWLFSQKCSIVDIPMGSKYAHVFFSRQFKATVKGNKIVRTLLEENSGGTRQIRQLNIRSMYDNYDT